jgi:hypothetical protein
MLTGALEVKLHENEAHRTDMSIARVYQTPGCPSQRITNQRNAARTRIGSERQSQILVVRDLAAEHAFDGLTKDVTYVFHIASPMAKPVRTPCI